jgi:hypothetical protein
LDFDFTRLVNGINTPRGIPDLHTKLAPEKILAS